MEDVQAERQVGDDVQDRDGGSLEAVHEVVVGIPAYVVGIHRSRGEVGEMPGDEQQDDDPAPPHRARREVGGGVVARRGVVLGPGPVIHLGQDVGGVDVQREGGDEHDADGPEDERPREDRLEQVA